MERESEILKFAKSLAACSDVEIGYQVGKISIKAKTVVFNKID
jgi:hypothetical protein